MARSIYGIDFGTSNIKIYNGLTKTILNEKNVIAQKDNGFILAFGDEAYEMYEKAPDNIDVVFPIKEGVVANLALMEKLFVEFYKKMTGPRGTKPGRFTIAVPADTTEVEKKAFYDVVYKSNLRIREIKIVEKPLADAVAIGIDMSSSRGNLIVNIGADTTELSVISNGGIVISHIIPIGGSKLNELICDAVSKKYNIDIGLKTAERIKHELADAKYNPEEDSQFYVYGRNVITGLPSERGVSKEVVCDAISGFFDQVAEAITNIIERTPPELTADILGTGLYLTGGSSEIKNIGEALSEKTEIIVNTIKNPAESIIRGVSMIISDSKYTKLLTEPRESSF